MCGDWCLMTWLKLGNHELLQRQSKMRHASTMPAPQGEETEEMEREWFWLAQDQEIIPFSQGDT